MYEVVFNLFVIVNVIGSRLGSMGSDAVNDGNCRQSCHFQKRDVGVKEIFYGRFDWVGLYGVSPRRSGDEIERSSRSLETSKHGKGFLEIIPPK